VQRCHAAFEVEWQQFAKREQLRALQQPLPRNWVPQLEAATNEVLYLDTRSNELHRVHPNLTQLKPHLEAQRAAGLRHVQATAQHVREQQELICGAAGGVLDDLHAQMLLM